MISIISHQGHAAGSHEEPPRGRAVKAVDTRERRRGRGGMSTSHRWAVRSHGRFAKQFGSCSETGRSYYMTHGSAPGPSPRGLSARLRKPCTQVFTAEKWRQLQCPSSERDEQRRWRLAPAVEKNEAATHAPTRMDLESVMPNERGHTQKAVCFIIPFTGTAQNAETESG